jgi:hypothetical protein
MTNDKIIFAAILWADIKVYLSNAFANNGVQSASGRELNPSLFKIIWSPAEFASPVLLH